MNVSLARALQMESDTCIAFVGAGGKTKAIFKLARELKSDVLVTTTTHLGAWQTEFADKHIFTDADSLDGNEQDLHGVVLVTGAFEGDRTKGVNDGLLRWLHRYSKDHSIPLLIEADGSRQKPLKAWAEHEPAIPDFVDLVVQMVGLTGLGIPLSNEYVHRAQIFSNLSDLKPGEIITSDSIVRVLTHAGGGMKNIPENARRIVLLNQADTPGLQSAARVMTTSLLSTYQSVIVASFVNEKIYAVYEPIAGIILAAGESTRFGKPKQLLDWKGQPFVRAVAQTAIRAGLSPVVVVTGANAEPVEATLKDLNVTVVYNENWQTGQGSSIKAGVKTLNLASPPIGERCGGAIFLLTDQPQVNPAILHALKEKHAEGLYPIVAPMVLDRRGNPVLFDYSTFSDLMTIEGDTGGRAIFHKHRVEYLPWHDDSLLLDVDTPEQYQRLISNEDV